MGGWVGGWVVLYTLNLRTWNWLNHQSPGRAIWKGGLPEWVGGWVGR